MGSDEARLQLSSRLAESARATDGVATRLVGLDEVTARSLEGRGCSFRVVRRDGVSLPVTMDLRSNRIHATINSGMASAVGPQALNRRTSRWLTGRLW